jgi:purine-binding chemotaxis protein CheW
VDAAVDSAILIARARRLAVPEDTEPEADDLVSVVVVDVAGERYALPLDQVAEIEPLGVPTPVPASTRAWLGLINLRGQVCPVLDVGRALGLDRPGARPEGVVVVVRAGGERVGLLVGGVAEIRRLRMSGLSPALPDDDAAGPGCCVGLTTDLVCLLDPHRLLRGAGVEPEQRR